MSVLKEILEWSKLLPAWQSDAIRRLFAGAELSADDLDDLYALLKDEHGIPDPKGRQAVRLTADDVPVPSIAGTKVTLLALKNLRHVNRIAEEQRLPFSPTGMTVVYGDNGSGKSGYSRVLKRACRARDQREPIHPNAFLPLGVVGAEATFEIKSAAEGDDPNKPCDEVPWVDAKPADPRLSSFAVFDARCARSYLDEEGDFAYVPYGLDILTGLAKTCGTLKWMIEGEQKNYVVDKESFVHLAGPTSVGSLLASLSRKTDPEQVKVLAKVSKEDLSRRNTIATVLNAGNPLEQAERLRLLASRITKIAQSLTNKTAALDDQAVSELRELVDAYHGAREAAALAAHRLRGDSNLLPGTGGRAWRELFEAARRFCTEAYPKITFPQFDPTDACPLCQQPLADGAELLRRFEEYIQQEAEKEAESRRDALGVCRVSLAGLSASSGLDAELVAEIGLLDGEIADAARVFEATLGARHKAVVEAIDSGAWELIPPFPPSPTPALTSLALRLQEEGSLAASAAGSSRGALDAEFRELEARIGLAKVKGSVLKSIEQLSIQAKLEACLSALKTNSISLKASELNEKVVSAELAAALNEEFNLLGAGKLQVRLQSRAEKGKTLRKLKLDLPQTKTPGEILSEGEQRAIALGSFMAEVRVAGGPGGIVFDDPVSSLDHNHRERVARRLAQEAAKRQVIILTHDLYFLRLLVDEAEKAKVAIETQSLLVRPEGFGVVDPDLPFEGMSTKARIGYLRNKMPAIQKAQTSGDKPEHKKLTCEAYSQLRLAWERAIEEVLLDGVVLRFRKGIESQRLAGVVVEDDDFATVDLWMTKCSNYAHDQAELGGVEVPDPGDLLADINALDNWREKIVARVKEVRKVRKQSAHG
jgi:hypothetical protein